MKYLYLLSLFLLYGSGTLANGIEFEQEPSILELLKDESTIDATSQELAASFEVPAARHASEEQKSTQITTEHVRNYFENFDKPELIDSDNPLILLMDESKKTIDHEVNKLMEEIYSTKLGNLTIKDVQIFYTFIMNQLSLSLNDPKTKQEFEKIGFTLAKCMFLLIFMLVMITMMTERLFIGIFKLCKKLFNSKQKNLYKKGTITVDDQKFKKKSTVTIVFLNLLVGFLVLLMLICLGRLYFLFRFR